MHAFEIATAIPHRLFTSCRTHGIAPMKRYLIQGNLVAYDWGETGIMENVPFRILSQIKCR